MRSTRATRMMLASMVAVALAVGIAPPSALAAPVITAAGSPAVHSAKTAAPKIVTPPKRTYVLRGEAATFRVSAKGSGLKYQWYRNYQPYARGLSDGGSSYKPVWRAIAGATKSSYTVKGALRLHSSRFRVVVSNAAGKVTSSHATLLVGSRYLTGPHVTPTRPGNKPFRPGELAFLEEWALSVQTTQRVKASATTDRVTVKVAAYSGYITSWMSDPVKAKPTSVLSIDIVSFTDGFDRTHRAKLSRLQGDSKSGFTFLATVHVPRGSTLQSWNVVRGDSYPQYFSSKTR